MELTEHPEPRTRRPQTGPGGERVVQSFLNQTDSTQLVEVLHPFHEAAQLNNNGHRPPDASGIPDASVAHEIRIWQSLDIPETKYRQLLLVYFEDFHTLSLLHKPTFMEKVDTDSVSTETIALIASMFTLSAVLLQKPANLGTQRHSTAGHILQSDSAYFHQLARSYASKALDESADKPPSLALLQAFILVTFYQLSQDARGVAWRNVGLCIRLAHELQLHLVDSSDTKLAANARDNSRTQSFHVEERRRAWWAIWELDIFASAVRRLPSGIDLAQTNTVLPISDKQWFAGAQQSSCRLHLDPDIRWKVLQRSENQAWQAWYIVVNSMMWDVLLLENCCKSYQTGTLTDDDGAAQQIGHKERTDKRSPTDLWTELKKFEERLSSCLKALPLSLKYHNEYLGFHNNDALGSEQSTLEQDYARYSLHIMTQLVRLMLYRCRIICVKYLSPSEIRRITGRGNSAETLAHDAWRYYLRSADNIVRIIRNSSPYHTRFVNPLTASAVWLAAVAQVVQKVFHPDQHQKQLAQAKFDILRHNFDCYVSIWGTAGGLQERLNLIEARLRQGGDRDISADVHESAQSRQNPNDREQYSYTGPERGANDNQSQHDTLQSNTSDQGNPSLNNGTFAESVSVPILETFAAVPWGFSAELSDATWLDGLPYCAEVLSASTWDLQDSSNYLLEE